MNDDKAFEAAWQAQAFDPSDQGAKRDAFGIWKAARANALEEGRNEALDEAVTLWTADIRAHRDGCPATFSNCVPDDCACGLNASREAAIRALKEQP